MSDSSESEGNEVQSSETFFVYHDDKLFVNLLSVLKFARYEIDADENLLLEDYLIQLKKSNTINLLDQRESTGNILVEVRSYFPTLFKESLLVIGLATLRQIPYFVELIALMEETYFTFDMGESLPKLKSRYKWVCSVTQPISVTNSSVTGEYVPVFEHSDPAWKLYLQDSQPAFLPPLFTVIGQKNCYPVPYTVRLPEVKPEKLQKTVAAWAIASAVLNTSTQVLRALDLPMIHVPNLVCASYAGVHLRSVYDENMIEYVKRAFVHPYFDKYPLEGASDNDPHQHLSIFMEMLSSILEYLNPLGVPDFEKIIKTYKLRTWHQAEPSDDEGLWQLMKAMEEYIYSIEITSEGGMESNFEKHLKAKPYWTYSVVKNYIEFCIYSINKLAPLVKSKSVVTDSAVVAKRQRV